jgi:hypothetical protein
MKRKATKRARRIRINAAMWKSAEKRLGKLSTKAKSAISKMFLTKSNPPAGWFDRCVDAVQKSGSAYDPNAVCGAMEKRRSNPERRRRGSKGGMRIVRTHKVGRRPRKHLPNPVAAAAERFEVTHGRPPEEVFEVVDQFQHHTVLAGYGKLKRIKILAVGDGRTVVTLGTFKGARLAENERANEIPQLFIVGGDTAVNVEDFGIDPSNVHEKELLGAWLEVTYETRKDHLGEAGGAGEVAFHVHPFGSMKSIEPGDPRRKHGSRLPVIIYDVLNQAMEVAGGGYDLPEVGIRG